jgi:hypothetical protein
MLTKITFLMDAPPETFICGFCTGRFQTIGDKGIGFCGNYAILCCSAVCARMYNREPDRFIDTTYLDE